MLLLVGAAIVMGSVIGGYVLEGGNLLLIVQPNEFIIIGGAAIGTLVLSTPLPLLKAVAAQIKDLFGSGPKREPSCTPLHGVTGCGGFQRNGPTGGAA